MTEPRPGFWHRLPLPAVAAAVMVVAIGVGIPVGLAVGAGSPEAEPTVSPGPTETADPIETGTPAETYEPEPDPTDTPTGSPESTEPTEPTESAEPTESTEPAESAEPSESLEDTAGPPSELSSPERDLWSGLEMAGVDRPSCRGYPDGEELDGVVAAVECAVEDPSISEPIVYYQFGGVTAIDDYIGVRSQEIDRVGRCEDGAEASGGWNVDGSPVGSYVCVDAVKDGETYFKIAFSDASHDTVAVVQDQSAADVIAWWQRYAAGQFYGVGDK